MGEKITGLNMVAVFALEENAAEKLVKHSFASTIAPLLIDTECQVRLAAAGALR